MGEVWKENRGSLVFDALRALLASAAARLLGQKDGLDVGQHATLCDGHTLQQLVQLLVVADGQLEVAGVDPLLLVVAGGVACQLEDLGREVLHDGGQVDRGASPHALRVVSLAEETMDSPNGELEPGTGRATLGLSAGLASFSTARHDLESSRRLEKF